MRNLFLILLLTNLLLSAWVFWVEPEPPFPARASGRNELVIFGLARPGAPAALADAKSECLYIGPVPDLNAVQQLSASLARRGIQAEPFPREGRVWLGHWVQIQGFANREAAEMARERLLQSGLPDAYVMQDGALDIISLGVFRERSRAERIIDAARRAGFAALMRERVRTATEYWLVSMRAGDQPAALAELAAGFDRILRAEMGACPPPADSPDRSVAPE